MGTHVPIVDQPERWEHSLVRYQTAVVELLTRYRADGQTSEITTPWVTYPDLIDAECVNSPDRLAAELPDFRAPMPLPVDPRYALTPRSDRKLPLSMTAEQREAVEWMAPSSSLPNRKAL